MWDYKKVPDWEYKKARDYEARAMEKSKSKCPDTKKTTEKEIEITRAKPGRWVGNWRHPNECQFLRGDEKISSRKTSKSLPKPKF